ncbi:MAG: hypothetical protein AVDCRST_MAG83-3110, partial [uncultured Arthrobacter sp.]
CSASRGRSPPAPCGPSRRFPPPHGSNALRPPIGSGRTVLFRPKA